MSRIEKYLRHERLYVAAMLVSFIFIETSINATSIIMEWLEDGNPTPAWVAFALEYTSGIVIVGLFPLVLMFEKWFPLDWSVFKRNIAWHVLGSVVFSILHIVLMAGLRTPLFRASGFDYQLDEFSWELLYEYRQDAWGYAFFLTVIYIYRFILSRLRGEAQLVSEGENGNLPEFPDRLLVKKLGKEFIIRVDDIEWLESSGNYVNLYIDNRIYPLRSTLNSLIAQLEPRGFHRIHRSFGVNLEHVSSINPLDSGDASIILNSGKVLPLSRRYRDDFRQRFELP